MSEIVEKTVNRNACLIFATSVRHGQHIVRVFKEMHGIECGFVTGMTPASTRERLIKRFRGERTDGLFTDPPLKYLCNINVLTTGFDAPHIDCVAMLRPTMSPGLFCQSVGRGFRLHPSKTDCLVLDFAGNILRHGPVDQITVGHRPKNSDGEAPVKECPQCNLVMHAGYTVCPECGHLFPKPEAKHEAKASEEAILSGEITTTVHKVLETAWSVHSKRNAAIDHPKTMRIEYRVGLREWVSEWVCPEHTGFARNRFESWWRSRSDEPAPSSAADTVALATSGCLAETKEITVRSVSGEEFDRIIDHELGEKPSSEMAFAARDGEGELSPVGARDFDYESIPF